MGLYGNGRVIDGEVLSVVDWLPLTPSGGLTMYRDETARYRLHVYDGTYEVLHKRLLTIDLDLNSPALPGILDRKLQDLSRQASVVENEPMDYPRLEVCDIRSGAVLYNWP